MPRSILYICGGRSFYSEKPGRKIYSVVKVWRDMGVSVDHLSGGDILARSGNDSPGYGAGVHHKKWYRRLPGIGVFVHSVSEFRDWLHDRKLYHVAKSRSQASKPGLIWERSSRLHYSGLLLAKTLKLPYVLEWKDNLLTYGPSFFKWYARIIETRKVKYADYIVVESEVLKNLLINDYEIDGDKVIVAHNAVDSEEFQVDFTARERIRNSIHVNADDFLVGYLGSYAFYHDSIRLVLAANCISNKTIKFVMVGDGKEFEATLDKAENLGLIGEKITFLPPVKKEDVPSFLSALDAAVLPGSTDIICPIKVQEYMSMGLPTVCPDYDCNREVVEHDVSGFLFKPFDEKSLANTLCDIESDRGRSRLVGLNGKSRMIEKFSWQGTWGSALNAVFGCSEQ